VPILTALKSSGMFGALAGLALLAAPAWAGLTLSQAVVDIQPGHRAAQDIEVWNDSKEIAYVVAEPAEVVAPGLADEHRVPVEDPSVGGLLVTPQRMILQPQERKLLRIAAVGTRSETDRVWRVVVKPVAGPVTAPVTAIKVLVGYDVLVILRPEVLRSAIKGARQGNVLTLSNGGNTNVELYDGKLCAVATPTDCKPLPSRRLYPGGQWQQILPGEGNVHYRGAEGTVSKALAF
jgi:P pilus assembly chaperone PapD